MLHSDIIARSAISRQLSTRSDGETYFGSFRSISAFRRRGPAHCQSPNKTAPVQMASNAACLLGTVPSPTGGTKSTVSFPQWGQGTVSPACGASNSKCPEQVLQVHLINMEPLAIAFAGDYALADWGLQRRNNPRSPPPDLTGRVEWRRDRFRPMASCVSALSSMVANGHQVLPCFPHLLCSSRTASLPRYGWKPALSLRALPQPSPAAFDAEPASLSVSGSESRCIGSRLCPQALGSARFIIPAPANATTA